MSEHLVFIGFHRTPDHSTPESQNELVAALLAEDGYAVRSGSAQARQLIRLVDQLWLVVRSLRWADVVVLCQFSGRRAWTTFLVARITRRASIPTIIVLRGGALPTHATTHRRQIDATFDVATRILAPSGYLQRAFEARGHRVGTLPNYVRMPVSGPRSDMDPAQPKVLWMRAFHPLYQPVLAVEAFSRLLEEHPHAELTMAGPDRGLLSATRDRVDQLGIAARVRFPGYLDEATKATTFQSHDLFLNTTSVDNSPVSVIEAMGAGLPVVATDVGGLRDLARPGEDAILVPDGDPAALAVAMSDVIGDSTLAGRLRASGQVIAARHSAATVLDGWKRELRNLGARGAPAPTDGTAVLSRRDLDDVVAIHCSTFPESALTQLGSRAVHRYYAWQFSGPHPSPVALGAWRDGQLVGFLFGGARSRAVAGFVRSSPGTLALAAISHPLFIRRAAGAKVGAIARATRGRQPSTPAPTGPIAAPKDAGAPVPRSFGILSVAVSQPWQGRGVADEILVEAERLARELRFTRMNLSVNVENTRAIRFYERHGWQPIDPAQDDGKLAKDLVADQPTGPRS